MVDYISPIFNIADSGIVVGVSLIFLNALLGWRRESSLREHR
jgi:lipoprotein signal peptidase